MESRKSKGLSKVQLGKMTDIDKRIIPQYETDKTIPSIDVAKKNANGLEISFDFLTGLDYSLFIHDQDITGFLKGYDNLKDEDKSSIKKLIKVFSFCSKVNETQKTMAV